MGREGGKGGGREEGEVRREGKHQPTISTSLFAGALASGTLCGFIPWTIGEVK